MAEHTPGPWSWDGPPDNIIVWSSPENRVCFLTSNGPTEANAALIAAAPDMLHALRRVLEQFGLTHKHLLAIEQAWAAVAKAEMELV